MMFPILQPKSPSAVRSSLLLLWWNMNLQLLKHPDLLLILQFVHPFPVLHDIPTKANDLNIPDAGIGVDNMSLLLRNYPQMTYRIKKNQLGVLIEKTYMSILIASNNNILSCFDSSLLSFCTQSYILSSFNFVAIYDLLKDDFIGLKEEKQGQQGHDNHLVNSKLHCHDLVSIDKHTDLECDKFKGVPPQLVRFVHQAVSYQMILRSWSFLSQVAVPHCLLWPILLIGALAKESPKCGYPVFVPSQVNHVVVESQIDIECSACRIGVSFVDSVKNSSIAQLIKDSSAFCDTLLLIDDLCRDLLVTNMKKLYVYFSFSAFSIKLLLTGSCLGLPLNIGFDSAAVCSSIGACSTTDFVSAKLERNLLARRIEAVYSEAKSTGSAIVAFLGRSLSRGEHRNVVDWNTGTDNYYSFHIKDLKSFCKLLEERDQVVKPTNPRAFPLMLVMSKLKNIISEGVEGKNPMSGRPDITPEVAQLHFNEHFNSKVSCHKKPENIMTREEEEPIGLMHCTVVFSSGRYIEEDQAHLENSPHSSCYFAAPLDCEDPKMDRMTGAIFEPPRFVKIFPMNGYLCASTTPIAYCPVNCDPIEVVSKIIKLLCVPKASVLGFHFWMAEKLGHQVVVNPELANHEEVFSVPRSCQINLG
uniref:Saposin B-type domain-containing protein n=1 Tax=Ditylenchus dipsaci TaxID=166011 RepID=A0A915ERZ5_9BILA